MCVNVFGPPVGKRDGRFSEMREEVSLTWGHGWYEVLITQHEKFKRPSASPAAFSNLRMNHKTIT